MASQVPFSAGQLVGWSTDATALVPGAFADVVAGAGHFPWFEAPGCVSAALARLLSTP